MRLYVDIKSPAHQEILQRRVLAAGPGVRLRDIAERLLCEKLEEDEPPTSKPVAEGVA